MYDDKQQIHKLLIHNDSLHENGEDENFYKDIKLPLPLVAFNRDPNNELITNNKASEDQIESEIKTNPIAPLIAELSKVSKDLLVNLCAIENQNAWPACINKFFEQRELYCLKSIRKLAR